MSIIIITFLNAIVFAIYCYLVNYFILERRRISIRKILMALIPYLLLYYYTLCLTDSIYSIFFSGFCAYLLIKIIFQENQFMSLFLSVLINIIKIIFKILILIIIDKESLLLINTYKTLDWNAFYIDLFAIILALIFIFILKKSIRKLMKNVSILKNRQMVLLLIIYINFGVILLFQPPGILTVRTISDFIMIFVLTGIVIFIIGSEIKLESLKKHYQEIFEYSRTNEELLTHYKMQAHENKNRLLMIDSMLDEPKKNIRKYINGLLKEINEDKSNINYWLAELKFIPLPGIRNFINYKLVILQKLGAQIEVFVSSELQNIKASRLTEKEYNQMSTMLGVIMDNMIESVKDIDDKLISINIYKDNETICCDFVNNFAGNIDLCRLGEIGYTTKGENHGVGLTLIAKIMKANDKFECYPEILDNFFIQHVRIKLSKKNIDKKSKKNDVLSQK